LIEQLKNKFPNFKYEFNDSFIKEKMKKKITKKATFYLSLSDLIKLKKFKGIKNAIKMTINFKEEVSRKFIEKISEHIKLLSPKCLLKISENQISFAGSFHNDLVDVLTELSILIKDKEKKKFYPILKSSIECFAFEEELFNEEWENKTYTKIDEETFKHYKEVSIILRKIREYLK